MPRTKSEAAIIARVAATYKVDVDRLVELVDGPRDEDGWPATRVESEPQTLLPVALTEGEHWAIQDVDTELADAREGARAGSADYEARPPDREDEEDDGPGLVLQPSTFDLTKAAPTHDHPLDRDLHAGCPACEWNRAEHARIEAAFQRPTGSGSRRRDLTLVQVDSEGNETVVVRLAVEDVGREIARRQEVDRDAYANPYSYRVKD